MSILAAFMVPHPPMIVPAVGRGSEAQISKTTAAYERVAEEIAAQLPLHREEMLEDARQSAERTEAFSKALQALGVTVYPSSSNFVLIDLGREAEPVICALKEKKILVRRCMDFTGINDGRHLRLAVKDNETNQVFIDTLKEILTCAENH